MLSLFLRVFLPAAALTGAFIAMQGPGNAQAKRYAYAQTGAETSIPYGWLDFCSQRQNAADCRVASLPVRDADHAGTWRVADRINRWVNANIEPASDADHYGVEDRWAYPDDGKGDCEDYVLLKRRLLLNAGVPRQALLITVVKDERNEGHAVLTLRTDKGDFVLDNKRDDVLPWTETGYRFVKRQSQSDPNMWIALGSPAPATVAATR